MSALKKGVWLAVFGPLLVLPFLRQRFWDTREIAQTDQKGAK